jgi:hypothetical protein
MRLWMSGCSGVAWRVEHVLDLDCTVLGERIRQVLAVLAAAAARGV